MIREVFSQTGANSRVLETDGADMVAREHDCWFSAEHAAKDSGIAQALAKAKGLHLPLNDATQAQYARMAREGLGELDKSGIAELTFPWPARSPLNPFQTQILYEQNRSHNQLRHRRSPWRSPHAPLLAKGVSRRCGQASRRIPGLRRWL